MAMILAGGHAVGQTAWPAYMPTLTPGRSTSMVRAVLPADVALVPPDAALPADKRRWAGRWEGWACLGAACDIQIAVEKVSDETATVVYAGASDSQAQVTDRAEGTFDAARELSVRLKTGARLALRLRDTGEMEMSLWRPDTQLLSAGVLIRDGQLPADTLTFTRSIERVPTPFTEGGRPVTLEMIVFRPNGPGPYPTLVFNHGSTGSGDRPEWFTQTWTAPAVARYFVEHGWQVLFPQRRGRGKSDGLYDEGFEPDRSRYSCDPTIALAGLDRAVADLDAVMAEVLSRADVDRQRLLIGGVSRGGILSAVYAGTHAQARFTGVLNFVGGWIGDRCPKAGDVNPVAFRRAAAFERPMLWLYGERDSFYTIKHSRGNFDAFASAGGKGSFEVLATAPGQNGHLTYMSRPLWQPVMDRYLQDIGATPP